MSCQTYFYSGAYDADLKRRLNIDQLFTVYHEKALIIDTINYQREHPEYTAKLMCDSGAFTHFQNAKKKGITLTDQDIYDYTDQYLEFLNEWGDGLFCFVAVDSVPDPENVDHTYADKTWDNYLYMWERLKPELRHKLIPVFHYGEDWKHLKRFLEHVHPDGTKLDYIGLAISLEGTRKVRINWGQDAMKIIAASSNPNVKTHAFGVGVRSVLQHIDVYSTDATSWVKRAAYGMIALNDKTIYISDIQKKKLCGNHYTEHNAAFQDEVEKRIAETGFIIDPYEINYGIDIDNDLIEFNTPQGHYVGKITDSTHMTLTDFNGAEEVYELTDAEGAPEGADSLFGKWDTSRKHLILDGFGKGTYDNGKCLSTNCYARAEFNILDTEAWMEPIRKMAKQTIKTKKDLGW